MNRRAKTLQTLALSMAFASLLLLSGCLFKGHKGQSINPLMGPRAKQGCKQKCDQLTTQQFYSVEEARSAMRDFLADYGEKDKCADCCETVEKMAAEFAAMDQAFSDVDSRAPKERYCAFLAMVNSYDYTFSGSTYQSVSDTWRYLINKGKEDYLEERLDLIDANDFKPHLIAFAEGLSLEWYGGGGASGWVVVNSYVVNNKMSTPVDVEGTHAKRCSCTVHVNMQGAMEMNMRSGSVEIDVDGTMSIAEPGCSLYFSKGEYKKGKVEGGLRRREYLDSLFKKKQ
jgi:hypothetical protein